MGYLISAACLLVLLIGPFCMGYTEEAFEEDIGITRVEHLVGLIDEYSNNASHFSVDEKDKMDRTIDFFNKQRNMGKSLLNFIVKKIASKIFDELRKALFGWFDELVYE